MTMTTLCNPGDRNDKVTIERAQVLIEKWNEEWKEDQQQDNGSDVVKVTTLDLQCRVYLVPAAELICQFLQDKVLHVKTAKLNDIIASLPTDEGLKVLSLLTTLLSQSPLEELNLDDNAMGIRGVQVCADILSCPTLRTLSLQNDGLSEESMTHLRKALVSHDVCHLKELHLYNNMIGSKGAKETGKILAACYQLQIFRYEGCRPGPEGTMGLVSGLLEMTQMKHNTSTNKTTINCPLQSLSLEGSLGTSDDEPVGTFCQALANLPNLKHLRLYDVGLESDGTKLVMKALSSLYHHQKTTVTATNNTTPLFQLERLELNQNEMDASAMISLSAVVSQHLSSLKLLQLESNEITSIGVERLMKVFKKQKTKKPSNHVALEELYLSENMIGSRGAQALIAAKHDNIMPQLKVLTLNDNGIPEELVEQLQACYGDILKDLTDNNDEDDCDDDLEEGDDEEEEDDEEDDEEDHDDIIDNLISGTNMMKLSPEDVSL